jgi:hypothetical protein
MSPTNQVILAGIAVLIIFLAAVLSSVPKKEQTVPPPATMGAAGATGTRTGTQIASISISRGGETQQGVSANPGVALSNGEANIPTGIQSQAEAGSATTVGVATSPDATAVSTANIRVTAVSAGGAIPAGSRVNFKIDTFKKLALQPLKFKVYDETGRELTPDYLQTVREHKLHFYVVSANLREYQHLFPEYDNGYWNVNANLPNPGTYYAYMDVSPIKGNPAMLRSELTVQTATKGTVVYPGLTPNKLAISGGVSTALTLSGIGIGAENLLSFSLTRGGQGVNGVSPYVGAFGSVVVLRQGDPNTLLVARPLPVSDESKGMFDFGALFSKAGKYTAFAEFKVDGKVLVFPITFEM